MTYVSGVHSDYRALLHVHLLMLRIPGWLLAAAVVACGPEGGDPQASREAPLREFRDCPTCPLMVELPPGSFVMGRNEEEGFELAPTQPDWMAAAETPATGVTISQAFAIGKYEVTFAEWDQCVEAGGCAYEPPDEGWGRGDRPVIHVGRPDAAEYVEWLRVVTGEAYRLPSEAEWEYAARGGTTTARWWGDELGSGRTVCMGCGSEWDDVSTVPVGTFPANPFGLHDMLGNVSEWVADCWNDTHEGNPGDGSAREEDSPWWKGDVCERPVHRGGSFGYYPWTVRAAKRSYYWPGPWTSRDSDGRGFRVARSIPAG